MTRYMTYIDDSGTKEYADDPEAYETTGNSRYFVFGAVLLSGAAGSELTEEIVRLKLACCGSEKIEVKSNWLRIPHERKAHYLDPFGMSDSQLNSFVEEFYCLAEHAELTLLAGVVDKPQMQEEYENPWYAPAIAYEILLQRVVQEIRSPDEVRVTVDDMTGATPAGNQYKRNLRRHHGMLRQSGSRLQKGLDFSALTGRCRFVDSAHSHLIQVADVVAYNVYRQFVDFGEEWEEEVRGGLPTYPWFNRLAGKFRQGPGGRIQGFGVVKMPLRRRIRWSVGG